MAEIRTKLQFVTFIFFLIITFHIDQITSPPTEQISYFPINLNTPSSIPGAPFIRHLTINTDPPYPLCSAHGCVLKNNAAIYYQTSNAFTDEYFIGVWAYIINSSSSSTLVYVQNNFGNSPYLHINNQKVIFQCGPNSIQKGTVPSPSWNFFFMASYGSISYVGFYDHGSNKQVLFNQFNSSCQLPSPHNIGFGSKINTTLNGYDQMLGVLNYVVIMNNLQSLDLQARVSEALGNNPCPNMLSTTQQYCSSQVYQFMGYGLQQLTNDQIINDTFGGNNGASIYFGEKPVNQSRDPQIQLSTPPNYYTFQGNQYIQVEGALLSRQFTIYTWVLQTSSSDFFLIKETLDSWEFIAKVSSPIMKMEIKISGSGNSMKDVNFRNLKFSLLFFIASNVWHLIVISFVQKQSNSSDFFQWIDGSYIEKKQVNNSPSVFYQTGKKHRIFEQLTGKFKRFAIISALYDSQFNSFRDKKICPNQYFENATSLIDCGTTCNHCPTQQFLDASSQCQPCTTECDECTGPLNSDCKNCSSTFYKNDLSNPGEFQCLGTCPNQNYPQPSLNQCLPCNAACDGCTGPDDTECNNCAASFLKYSNGGSFTCLPSCPPQTYISSNQCLPCNAACDGCSGPNDTDCNNCASSFLKYTNAGSFTCLPSCPPQTYTSSNQCLQCNAACDGCTGPDDTDCNNCASSFFKYTNAGICTCLPSCPPQTYISSNQCLQCDPSCDGCTGSSNSNCINCSSSYVKNDLTSPTFECLPSCPTQKYQLSKVCQPCDVACDQCTGSTNYDCNDCSTNPIHYRISSLFCDQTCPIGTYPDLVNQSCINCSNNCLTCIGLTNCTDCIQNYFLQVSQPTCLQDCTNSTFKPISGNKCVASCWHNQGSNQCQHACIGSYPYRRTSTFECSNNCLHKLGQTQCINSCQSTGQFIRPNSLGVNECVPCDSTCKNCSGTQNNQCTQCYANFYLDPNSRCQAQSTQSQLKYSFTVDAQNNINLVFNQKITIAASYIIPSDRNLQTRKLSSTNTQLSQSILTLQISGPFENYVYTYQIFANDYDQASSTFQNLKIALKISNTIREYQNVSAVIRFNDQIVQVNQSGQVLTILENLSIKLNKQSNPDSLISQQELQEIMNNVTSASQGIVGSNLITALIMDAGMRFLWQAVNTAQLVEFLPLVCGPMPTNTKVVFKAMSFANGDFQVVNSISKDFSDQVLTIQDQNLETPPLSQCFEENQFETTNYYLNYRPKLFLVSVYIAILLPLSLLFYCIISKLPCPCLCMKNRLKSCFSIDFLIRTSLEMFLELILTSALCLSDIKFRNKYQIVSSVMAIISMIISIFFLILTIYVITKFLRNSNTKHKQWKGKVFTQQISIKKHKAMRSCYVFFFLLQRTIFTVILVFIRNNPRTQATCLFFLFLAMLIYVVKYKPFQERISNILIIVEQATFVLVLFLLCFIAYAGYKLNEKTLEILGFTVIGIVGLCILSSLTVALVMLWKEIFVLIRKKCRKNNKQIDVIADQSTVEDIDIKEFDRRRTQFMETEIQIQQIGERRTREISIN